MLEQLISKACKRIASRSPALDVAAMSAEIKRARPDILRVKNIPAEVTEALIDGVAQITIAHIRKSAALAQSLLGRLNKRQGSLPQQVAIAGVLAYFVQPRDLIPDDAPAGYGFIDDTILLRAGYEQVFHKPPDGETQSNTEVIGFLSSLVPLSVLHELDLAVKCLQSLVEMLSMLDAATLTMTRDMLMNSPLATAAVSPSTPGVRSAPGLPGQGRFSHGMYFEGNNVFVPGGPSLIDGQLFIPS
jgi:uncharacterized membrane protein YkvA (DUF1232 family)